MTRAARIRLLADIGPLREYPAFRRLWAGTALSSVGSALTSFAVILQVYDLTRSPLAVGAIGMAQMVPTLVIGLVGGSVTDATDRRKLVLVTSGGLAAVSAALAAQAFAGLRLVWLLYALAAVQSSLSAINAPARTHLRSQPAAGQQAARRPGAEPAQLPDHADRRPGSGRPHHGRTAPRPPGVLSHRRGQLRRCLVRGGQAAADAAAGRRSAAGPPRGSRGSQLHPPQPTAGRRLCR